MTRQPTQYNNMQVWNKLPGMSIENFYHGMSKCASKPAPERVTSWV